MPLATLLNALKDLAFPPGCPGCGAMLPAGRGRVFCPSCQAGLMPVAFGEQPRALGPVDQVVSLYWHQGPAARAVRGFKYRRQIAAGASLAALWAGRADPGWLKGADLAAPVPLHPRRLLRRGFNQAALLARWLKDAGGPRWEPRLLLRTRHTRPQVGMNQLQRRENVAGAFAVRRGMKGRLQGKTVLLVDDVYTTGATCAECARVLKQAGAARVWVHTLVRAGEPKACQTPRP